MTRDKAINILARLAGGATQPSWDEIRKAAQFACSVLSASPEDSAHIQFNDERTFKKEQPQGLDEAADCYKDTIKPEDVDDYEHCVFYETYTEQQIADAFIAGAKWMAEQGVRFYFDESSKWSEVTNFVMENCKGRVIVQIRKI